MLAAHRDQENLVHSRQVPSKQQPKTPGTRYPKTPLRFRNDENAPTAFTAKTGMAGAVIKAGKSDKLSTRKGHQQAMITPMGSSPPPSSNTSQARPTAQKISQKTVGGEPVLFDILADKGEPSEEDDEPEYAPPAPTPLPYESDVLPPGGLTFEGLKKVNFLKGFYEHFHNPIDEDGISREQKRFNREMEAVLGKAREHCQREAAEIDWNTLDIEKPEAVAMGLRPNAFNDVDTALDTTARPSTRRNPPTMTSRRAVSALALASVDRNAAVTKPPGRNPAIRRPLSSIISSSRAAKPALAPPMSTSGNIAAEAASRTTIGYTKGRTASSMIRSRGGSVINRPKQASKPSGPRDGDSVLATTLPCAYPGGLGRDQTDSELVRPQFLCIFDDVDDEDLPPMRGPYLGDDKEEEEEEEFELKLTI
ncbi:hypothetical protein DCS_06270 [Drechmeria coniospora]|uniref:Uncharacterized protein n=1 Tax=Drechmeria coniospora TaxID=98403 RepID=A0A151GB81_DRECN|nr:hypothetical protein DCS_06270 [Drechmeria coniospora]KYK54313.1 hypothetical protein DCS_06270 [Drechmeria coniospora]